MVLDIRNNEELSYYPSKSQIFSSDDYSGGEDGMIHWVEGSVLPDGWVLSVETRKHGSTKN